MVVSSAKSQRAGPSAPRPRAKDASKMKASKKLKRSGDVEDAELNGDDGSMAADSLPWAAIDMPGEAAAMAGETDADFYEGLDVNDDDYMGLTELDGIEIVKDAAGGIRFVQSGDKKGKRRKAQQVLEVADDTADLETAGNAKNVAKASKKDKNVEKADTPKSKPSAHVDLPPTIFADEDDGAAVSLASNDEDSDAESSSIAPDDAEVNADFRLLNGDVDSDAEGEGSEVRTWTGKELSKYLPAWKKLQLKLHPRVYTALEKMTFKTPTGIQAASLPLSMASEGARRDVVGIAQTGSGKTLAYALPLLQWIASNPLEDRQMQLLDGLKAGKDHGTIRLAGLVLAPTRELALQVTKHIQAIIDASSAGPSQRWASVVAVTGGISEEKQRRLLQAHHGRGADIIVATPGRLWDMCKSDDILTRRIKAARFLVIDEADRMIETGHFAEMENILGLVRRAEDQTGDIVHTAGVRGGASDLQTLVFSATLSKELQHNLKRKRSSNKRRHGTGSSLDDLMDLIDFRDEDPAVVNLSTKTRIASSIVEIKSECLAKEKDLYLYYFLLRYPGRTLVFVNSIDGIRRLQPLLANLGTSVHPLHSQLQQKQRLKNLDRFRASRLPTIQSSAVLLATDVAARGLDIPAVDHVVHLQLPRSTDTYVHRSGRTARAGQSGVSLALIDPSEKRLWRDLCRNLKRVDDLPTMPVEYSFLPLLRERIELARKLDQKTHTQNKEAHDDAWLKKLAAEAEMDMSDADEEDESGNKSSKSAFRKRSVAALRAQLDELLQQPLRARGISFKYLTGGNREFLDGILADTQHDTMIGVQRTTVQTDLTQRQKEAPKPRAVKSNGVSNGKRKRQ